MSSDAKWGAGRDDARPDPSCALAALRMEHILARFRATAARVPHKLALVHPLASWTFAQLDRSSSRLAQELRASGIGSGDVVAVVTGREPGLVCALLGILKAGAAFATVNEAYPDARIATCLYAARACHVIVVGQPRALSAETLRDLPTTHLSSVPSAESSAPEPEAFDLAQPAHDRVAYLMFTSGSTGEPKCIATGHAPLPHFLSWQVETFGLSESDHFSMLSGLSHDPLLRDIFGPLSIGATLHIPEQRVLTDPSALFAWLAKEEITVAHLTPPLGQVLLAGAEGKLLPAMRYFFWGGDVLRPGLVKEVRAVAARASHVNFYGTTETPQGVGFFEVRSDDTHARIPLGIGIADVDLLVLLESGALAPVGALGELVVRSRYLSLGYWGDERGNADKYLTNPQTADPQDRLYRTGDLAKYAPDGNVEFWGRADDQIKIRGYRVELSEVTAILSQCAALREVAVLARAHATGDMQLVAYVTAVPGSTVSSATLAAFAELEMPAHMRPAAYVQLDALPLLENGKLNRKALLELPFATAAAEQAGSERERALAKIWADVLGVSTVGIHDSFYRMGGDSLTAIRVMVNMRTLGLDPDLCRQIFQGRTIAEMAAGNAGPETNGERPRDLDVHRRLVLNVMRGLMVTLVVAAHWGDSLFRRSASLARLERYFNPIFNWPTPGFAIAFGMTLGMIHYPIYLANPARARALLHKSALLVGVGMLILAADRWILGLLGYPRGAPLGILLVDTVLTYYFLALLTALFWFRAIRGRHTALKAVCISVVLILIYSANARPDGSFTGESFWELNIVSGKYSYLSLSGGALFGVALGILFTRQTKIPMRYLGLGSVLALVGIVLSRHAGRLGVLEAPNEIYAWEWLVYCGATLLTLFAIDRALASRAQKTRGASTLAHVMGVIGQLALPLFILDLVARDLGYFSVLFPIPALRFAIPLLVFGAVGSYLAIKTYGLYYGRIKGTAT